MVAFLQAYGSWIVFGLLLVLMFRMHAGGGSGHGACGDMSHDDTAHDDLRRPQARYIVDVGPTPTAPLVRNQDSSLSTSVLPRKHTHSVGLIAKLAHLRPKHSQRSASPDM